MDYNAQFFKKFKVSFLTGTLEGGGAERLQIILSNYFSKKGIETEFVTFKKVGSLVNNIPDTVNFIDLNVKRILTSYSIYRNYIKNNKPKVVVSSVTRPNIIACLGKAFNKKSHKLIIRIDNAPFNGVSIFKQPSHYFLLCICMITYPFTDGIICISKAMKEQILSFPFIRKEKVHLIYNPVISSSYVEKLNETLPETAKSIFCDGIPVILAAGRLHPQKDYPTLLKAFSVVRKQIDCRLVILGEGSLLNELIELSHNLGISESVHFVGFVENPLPWMKNADVFVLSSIYEGLSNVLIEALAAGTPVISTNCPTGPAEVLKNGRFGDLVAVRNHNALAESIIKSLMTPKVTISDELRNHLQQFHVETAGESYLNLVNLLSGA